MQNIINQKMMNRDQWQNDPSVLGLYMSFLTKQFIGTTVRKLSHTGLDRYYRILVAVEQSGETFTQQNLSDYFKINKTSMVRIIDDLTRKGFLERRVNPHDRREHLLVLTEKARNVLPQIKQTLSELERTALRGFTAGERQQFLASLERVYTNMLALPADDVFLNFSPEKVTNRREPELLDSEKDN